MKNCMGKCFSGRILSRIILMFFVLGMASLPLQAEMTQKPLFLVGNVGPNILFLIDDSGSMHCEFMPDITYNNAALYYAFPPDNDYVYIGGGIYKNEGGGLYPSGRVITFNDNDGLNAFFRSSHNNPLYYNPAKTYEPWVRHDGSLYPHAPTDAAPDNPGYYYDYGTGFPRTGEDYMDNRTRNLQEVNEVVNTAVTVNRYAYPLSWAGYVSTNNKALTTRDTFWPAVYFHYKGSGDVRSWDSYEKVVIEPGKEKLYVGHGREARRDCERAGYQTCDGDEEMQNFANWYSYHRSRALTAKAGIGKAFRNVGDSVRVGYGSINTSVTVDGKGPSVVRRGVRSFYGQDKIDFYRYLYEAPIYGGTPLHKALDSAGTYYSRSDNQGPWGNTPGDDDKTDHITCRGCYTILMTDGYYDSDSEASTSKARDNNDGRTLNNQTHISSTGGETFTYKAVNPFTDGNAGTLADVAMYYWKRNLRPDFKDENNNTKNNVPVAAGIDPAFWPHMVTFTVGFGVTGTIDPEDAFAAMRTSDANGPNGLGGTPTISWPKPDNNERKIDDLLHAAVNGRGNFLSANDPEELAEGMEEVLGEVAKRSAGSISAVATNSTSASDSTLIFQAFMDSADWTGGLRAYKIKMDGTIGDRVWTTKDTDPDGVGKIKPASSRDIYTWLPDSKKGVSFIWNNLTNSQKGLLNANTKTITVPNKGQDRLSWLRGDQTKEIKNRGIFRNRSTVIGDIVYSDPAIVGPDLNFGYEDLPSITLGKGEYKSFVSGNAARKPVLYVGANDGMLHAFDARTTKKSSNDTEDGGKEIFSYVPNLVFDKLAALTDPSYEHQYYVNGSPAVGHAYLNGSWKTILVGSLGAGGKGLFALDVTSSDSFTAQNIMWEMDEATFGAENWKDLGYMLGPPVLAHTKDGSWVVIFGNGYESVNGKASLMIVGLKDGKLIRKIEVPAREGCDEPNGLSAVALLADDDRTIFRVYAGDLHGQIWKFDLTGNSPASWDIGNGGNPLFTAKNFVKPSDDRLMPITAPLAVRNHPASTSESSAGYLLYFGTGAYYDEKKHNELKNNSSNAFYCIWDRNDGVSIQDYDYDPSLLGGGLNGGPLLQQKIIYEESMHVYEVSWCTVMPGSDECPANAPVSKVTYVTTNDTAEINAMQTETQKIIGYKKLKDSDSKDLRYDIRITSSYSMNWYADDNPNGYRGWYLPLIPPSPLTDIGERMTSKASLRNDKVLFTTLVPAAGGSDDPCSPTAESWFMQLDAFTGGATAGSSFDMNKDGTLSDNDLAAIKGGSYAISGVKSGGGVKTLGSFLSVGNLQIALLSSSTGAGIETWGVGDTKLPESGRHSWREIFF
ncbi:hypothetical protein LJC24_00775 [Desulfococcaceae bacterium OttesenSCG-928-F15]|nr:hypothetical protein [Desulfococcaceae bacterium OttesenSCG-928-F15]